MTEDRSTIIAESVVVLMGSATAFASLIILAAAVTKNDDWLGPNVAPLRLPLILGSFVAVLAASIEVVDKFMKACA